MKRKKKKREQTISSAKILNTSQSDKDSATIRRELSLNVPSFMGSDTWLCAKMD